MYRYWSRRLSWSSFHWAHQSSRPQLGLRLWHGQAVAGRRLVHGAVDEVVRGQAAPGVDRGLAGGLGPPLLAIPRPPLGWCRWAAAAREPALRAVAGGSLAVPSQATRPREVSAHLW